MEYHVAIAAGMVGGTSALAKALGVTPGAVSQIITGRRPLPEDRAPSIERVTEGRVTCEQMRPDVTWVRVPDVDWPHPAGRPCIDVAAQVSSAPAAAAAGTTAQENT